MQIIEDHQKTAKELRQVILILSCKQSAKKTRKKTHKGIKMEAVSTAARVAGVLTAGISLATGLVFVGITSAAGSSNTVVGGQYSA